MKTRLQFFYRSIMKPNFLLTNLTTGYSKGSFQNLLSYTLCYQYN